MRNLGVILTILRVSRGLTQTKLARLSGVKRSSICTYENGKATPDAVILSKLLTALRYSWSTLDRVERFLNELATEDLLREEDAGDGPSGGREALRSALIESISTEFGKATARLSRSLVDLAKKIVEEHLQGDCPAMALPVPSDREAAPGLWAMLGQYTPEEQQTAIETVPQLRSWALCEFLALESERQCAGDANEGVRLAELAVFLASVVPGTEAWRVRLRAFALAHLANALRVAGDLRAAEQTFAQVAGWWSVGVEADPAGLLSEARVLALIASLRIAQGRVPEALFALGKSLALCDGDIPLKGRVLISRARALEETGAWEEAIASLQQAEPLVDAERDSRLLLCVRHNLVWLLANSDRAREAEELLPDLAILSRTLGGALDRVRLQWVMAKVAAEQGETDRAITLFLQVRGEFASRKIWFDTALASLEIAVLYAEQGKVQEVKGLARHLVPVFQAQDVHREALAALTLFRRAAEEERVTVELAKSLRGYFRRARYDSNLRFRPEEAVK